MTAHNKRILIWTGLAAMVGLGLFFAFAPRPVAVDLVTIAPAPMVVTADEEGETRVHDVFVLSAPVAGRVQRIESHVGDPVVADVTVLARIEPSDPTFLDSRTEAQARASLQAAESTQVLAAAEVERARAEFEFAEAEHGRARELIVDGTIAVRDADAADRGFKTARAGLATALAALQMRSFELEQAKAQLISPSESRAPAGECDCVSLTAPVSGRVLQIVSQSERNVYPGDPLVEIGDPADLEIVVDFLSMDAVRIQAGHRVIIERWGGDEPLAGRVRRVEPFGFRKVSALGIEERRVNVIIDLTSPVAAWSRLGHGYQVEARVVLFEVEAALSVPLTALFRNGEEWAVFVHQDDRAVLRTVEVGHRNGVAAEIVAGIDEGDQVVLHPSNRVVDGVRIAARS